jgi:cobalt/nickel transport system ATP-binding protein
MDEPSAGLDPRSHSWLIEFIREQHHLGNTMVIATHDLSLAEEIATSVYVFDEDHHIVSSGEPREVLGDHELLHRCNLYHYHSRAEHHDTR